MTAPVNGGYRVVRTSPSKLAWLYFTGIFLLYVAIVLGSPGAPALQDYPDWIYQSVLFRDVVLGHPIPGYVLKAYPVPNSLMVFWVGLAATVVSWVWAAKLWLVLHLLLAAGATLHLCRALRTHSTAMLVTVPTLLFLNLDFWYGNENFQWGICFVILWISTLLRGNTQRGFLAAFLVLIFFTHMICCACAALLLVTFARQRREYRLLLALLPVFLLMAWYVLGRYLLAGNADDPLAHLPGPKMTYGSVTFLVFKVNAFFKLMGFVNVLDGSGHSITFGLLPLPVAYCMLVCTLVAAIGFYWLAWVRWRSEGRSVAADFRWLWEAAVILLIGAILAPANALGVADPGSRLLALAMAIVVFDVLRTDSKATAAVSICVVVLSFLNLGQFAFVQYEPEQVAAAAPGGLPPALVLRFAHVQPGAGLEYYEHIESRQMDLNIFPTALFLRK